MPPPERRSFPPERGRAPSPRRRLGPALVAAAAALGVIAASTTAVAGGRPHEFLFVACGIEIQCQTRIDLETGDATSLPVTVRGAESLVVGPDSNIYVGLSGYQGGDVRGVVRFDWAGESLESVIDFKKMKALESSGGPEGLSFGPDGDLYFNTRVSDEPMLPTTGLWRWAIPDGPLTHVAGSFGTGNGEGTAFLTAGPFKGHLLAAAYADGTIVRVAPPFDAEQEAITFISGVPDANGIAVDEEGDVYVALEESGDIYRFAPDGALIEVFAHIDYELRKLAFDGEGNLYVTSPEGPIHRVSPDGEVTQIGDVLEGNGVGVVTMIENEAVTTLDEEGGCACRSGAPAGGSPPAIACVLAASAARAARRRRSRARRST